MMMVMVVDEDDEDDKVDEDDEDDQEDVCVFADLKAGEGKLGGAKPPLVEPGYNQRSTALLSI